MERRNINIFRSTGVKMFLILTLALLPLGLVALVASLQAIRTADLEKEALLRVAVTQSARKLSTDINAERAAVGITLNLLASEGASSRACVRLALFLEAHDGPDSLFYIYDRNGRRLCGSRIAEPPGMVANDRFGANGLMLLPQTGYLVSRVLSGNSALVALTYYSRDRLEAIADPTTALQSRQLTVHQNNRRLVITRHSVPYVGSHSTSLSAQVDPFPLKLTMTMRDPPATLARMLSMFLPLVMWFAAAGIGWFVVNRLLIRPLVLLRRSVAAYEPGQVLQPLQRVRTPALEITALGETFREISEDVATHEAEMAEGLETQRKLTREVHHRVKNNLQIIASLINLHSRSAKAPEAAEAYASIQRRVDALSVVHRNHFAELEENRGVGLRPLVSELSASLRSTAPENARRFAIQIDCDDLHISQDVAVPVSFLLTELVELAMMNAPHDGIQISVRKQSDRDDRGLLAVISAGFQSTPDMAARIGERYGRVLTGLSRQLRAPLDHDAETGRYSIVITVVP